MCTNSVPARVGAHFGAAHPSGPAHNSHAKTSAHTDRCRALVCALRIWAMRAAISRPSDGLPASATVLTARVTTKTTLNHNHAHPPEHTATEIPAHHAHDVRIVAGPTAKRGPYRKAAFHGPCWWPHDCGTCRFTAHGRGRPVKDHPSSATVAATSTALPTSKRENAVKRSLTNGENTMLTSRAASPAAGNPEAMSTAHSSGRCDRRTDGARVSVTDSPQGDQVLRSAATSASSHTTTSEVFTAWETKWA